MAKRTREMLELPRARIQIYGDSVADGALNDKVLAAACGLSLNDLQNVSLPSSSAFFAATLLERQIQSGTAPQILILAYNARSFSVPMVPKWIAHFAGRPETFSMIREDRPPPDAILRGFLNRFSFCCRYQTELNSVVRYRTGQEVFQPHLTPALGILERQAALPASLAELPAENAKPGSAAAFAPGFSNGPFLLHPEMRRSLDRFFDLAAEAGITVLIVSMPKPPAAQELHEKNGFNFAYQELLTQFSTRSGVRLLLQEQRTLPPEDFFDAVHLTRHAAIRFSEEVGQLLQSALSPPQ